MLELGNFLCLLDVHVNFKSYMYKIINNSITWSNDISKVGRWWVPKTTYSTIFGRASAAGDATASAAVRKAANAYYFALVAEDEFGNHSDQINGYLITND